MLYLASQSPRRRALLQQIGVSFEVFKVDVPEVRQRGETAMAYVRRVAHDKARAAWALRAGEPGARVLAADTEVVLDGEVFGKPADAAAATAMLQRLRGREHEVISSVWLLGPGRELHAHCLSHVHMAELEDADIAAYVATGEPFGKAGGYAIQGRAAAFITHLEGSYSGVMGLPLHATARLLRQWDAGLAPSARGATDACIDSGPAERL